MPGDAQHVPRFILGGGLAPHDSAKFGEPPHQLRIARTTQFWIEVIAYAMHEAVFILLAVDLAEIGIELETGAFTDFRINLGPMALAASGYARVKVNDRCPSRSFSNSLGVNGTFGLTARDMC